MNLEMDCRLDSPFGNTKALDSGHDDGNGTGNNDGRKRPQVESSHGSFTTKKEIKDGSLETITHQSYHYSNSGVAYDYICERLRNHKLELDSLRKANTNILLSCHKKLHLVLDLDHTLLHSTNLAGMSPEEAYLKTQTDQCLESIDAFRYERPPDEPKMIKLRPFVRTFLKEASDMFELSVYTAASRPYALKIIELLGKDYFGSRVISRDDTKNISKKCMELMHGKESAVLILDDNMLAWRKEDWKNLIQLRPYRFFKSKSAPYNSIKSLSELKTDEIDETSQQPYLTIILQLLKQIHSKFFDDAAAVGDKLIDRDVRKVLTTFRTTLKGCKIVIPPRPDINKLRKMAGWLGATCVDQVDDPSVTHVVEEQIDDAGRLMATKGKRFLVHFRWIEETYFKWQKQPEDKFPVPVIEQPRPEVSSTEEVVITIPNKEEKSLWIRRHSPRSVFLPVVLDPVTLLAKISGLIGRKRKLV